MMNAEADPGAALAALLREGRGRLLAALIAELRDFDLAEEALAEASAAALAHWARGMPRVPAAWLLQVARRKAVDRLRRNARWRAREEDLARLAAADEAASAEPPPEIADERLRLIFTCCHPALDEKSRIALTLRSLCGLSTGEIARAFLDREPAMGQRLSRAKAKILAAGIPYRVPGPEEFGPRLSAVLAVIYLVFNEGYAASTGTDLLRRDLCEEAIFLARMLAELQPEEPEVLGLLSLLLTSHARVAARLDGEGALVPLDRQDRSLWHPALLAEGIGVLDRAQRAGRTGPYQLKAAISALLMRPSDHASVDWAGVRDLHDALMVHEPTPVVALNRWVAAAEAGDLAGALMALEALAPALARYQPFHAARAELRDRAGHAGAGEDFALALALSGSQAERQHLAQRLSEVEKKRGRAKARPKSNREDEDRRRDHPVPR